MPELSFYERLKAQQVAWAAAHGISHEQTEASRHRPWVLKSQFKALNLWRPGWWSLIAGKEHLWARSLTSSQCFAVNLFAPLIGRASLARELCRRLLPERGIDVRDTIELVLEFTPDGARHWLGERDHPTQVDAALVIRRDRRPSGYLLIEVKLGESAFGSCSGVNGLATGVRGNPRPERCLHLASILGDPARQCWLTESEGRRYWEHMLSAGSSFRFDHLPADDACPFGSGLYQLMRNKVLAHSLVSESGADWADFALCAHPKNQRLYTLGREIAGTTDARAAFRSLFPDSDGLREIDPSSIVEAMVGNEPEFEPWGDWICERYEL